MFGQSMPNYDKMTYVTRNLAGKDIDRHVMRTESSAEQEKLAWIDELSDDELMLAPPTLFGFSLADKEWRKYHILAIGGARG